MSPLIAFFARLYIRAYDASATLRALLDWPWPDDTSPALEQLDAELAVLSARYSGRPDACGRDFSQRITWRHCLGLPVWAHRQIVGVALWDLSRPAEGPRTGEETTTRLAKVSVVARNEHAAEVALLRAVRARAAVLRATEGVESGKVAA